MKIKKTRGNWTQNWHIVTKRAPAIDVDVLSVSTDRPRDDSPIRRLCAESGLQLWLPSSWSLCQLRGCHLGCASQPDGDGSRWQVHFHGYSQSVTTSCAQVSVFSAFPSGITLSKYWDHVKWLQVLSFLKGKSECFNSLYTKDRTSGLTTHNASVLKTACEVHAFKNSRQIGHIVKHMVIAPFYNLFSVQVCSVWLQPLF